MNITQASIYMLDDVKQTGGLIEYSDGLVAPKFNPELSNLGKSIQDLIRALWEQENIDFEMPVQVVSHTINEQTSNQSFYGIRTEDTGPGVSSLIIENSQGDVIKEFDHRWFDVSTRDKIEDCVHYYYSQGLIHESDFHGLDEYISELEGKANI